MPTFCTVQHDLDEILKKHPEYTRIYLDLVNKGDKLVLKLSKGEGKELYMVSNMNHDNLEDYLKKENKIEEVHESSIQEKTDNNSNQNKRFKQQSLFNFIKKQ